jgi:flavin reductase (DIM6/NTAB) family NADH-FMN oxidoreductase RutF
MIRAKHSATSQSTKRETPQLVYNIDMPISPIDPPIFYWGTPVVLITTRNLDGSTNIAPMSSAWWLGKRCMLGLASTSQTTINLLREKECVLNLASDDMAANVNALARTTGSDPLPDFKVTLGYRTEKDKFGAANLTPLKSDLVRTERIKECPVQMEAKLMNQHMMMESAPDGLKGFILAIEVQVVKTWVEDSLRLAGHANRIDPDAWKPMIMSFQHLYGLKNGKVAKSTLANVEEELYRFPDSI